MPRLYLRSRERKQPWLVRITSYVPDSRRESTGFSISIGRKLVYVGMGFLNCRRQRHVQRANWVVMLCTVRHLWPSRDSFVFNCYRHWSSLVLHNMNGTASILHSIECVAQGNPLPMISYGIRILPLIKNMKRLIPDVTHPWYDDNTGALGTFARLDTYFDSLTCQGS